VHGSFPGRLSSGDGGKTGGMHGGRWSDTMHGLRFRAGLIVVDSYLPSVEYHKRVKNMVS